ncbi:MAG: hypothetical protein WAV32_04430 [Halobacteriota archaeon]
MTVRGASVVSKTEENYDEVCSWGEDIRMHLLDIYGWVGIIIDAERTQGQGYRVYTKL